MSAARDMAEYVGAAFATYENMRDQRDEALTRCCELEDQRDQARRIAAALEAEVAKVRALHRPVRLSPSVTECVRCYSEWPCETASAVYLP